MEGLTDQANIGFEHAPVGLVVARHRVIQTSNSKLREIFGCRRYDLAGQSLSS